MFLAKYFGFFAFLSYLCMLVMCAHAGAQAYIRVHPYNQCSKIDSSDSLD